MNAQESQPESTPRVSLGGDYWEADPGVLLWGFADLHAHLMAHLAFGGKAFWGQPFDPEHPGSQGIEYALNSCEPIHGGLFNVNPEFGHPAGGGWPEFIIWPRFTTLVHQQAYLDWLYRAYQGGLRLITCLAVNNELLASKTNPKMPHDDKSAIQVQLAAIKEMVAFVDAQSGGAGKGWLQIVYTPDEARRVIGQNRLAVILGVEVDSLGNWRGIEDLEKLCRGDLDLAREVIGQELDWLYGLGVRQITPIHLINNAFGGTAIYLRFLETVNLFVTGEHWSVEDAWETGVRYRLDHDGADLVDDAERTVAITGRHLRTMHRRTLMDHIPGVRDLVEAIEAPKVRGGHANTRGLNQYGNTLLQEMMKRGMIIDVDHMSEKATDAALGLAEENSYPVICSHTWFRDLLFSAQIEFDPEKQEHYGTSDVHKVAHEAGKRSDQIERIARLGGVVAPILNQGDIAGLRRSMPELAGKIAEPCAGSSTSFGQAYLYAITKMGGRGVALGSDVNGAAGLPGPRFGTFAAYGARNDARRTADRRGEIDRQTNGVAYANPIRDHRWHRFESSGEGAYDEEECDIWQAIAQYEAGFNPLIEEHLSSDFPDSNLREALKRAKVIHIQEWVDNVTKGFWLADQEASITADQAADWPVELRAAYFSRKESLIEEQQLDERILELMNKIKGIWSKWAQMKGNNRPLVRSTAGPRRDFDINLDGMAHYGMLPDLLQDLRNVGLTAEDLAPLFRSANDYIEMWDKCDYRAHEITHPQ
ncbi:MAG: membrane dipeptidase [Anaerolineales bacterium]|jgi:microsomal dipeptidase-like Zn-dependent dipeptidase